MYVKLISYTQGMDDLVGRGLQELIAYCARVSNPANQNNTLTSDKLNKYLLEHKHFSPFEMVSACLEINTTRDIGRQILRHRSFSFQEFSQRYADPTSMQFEYREARLQDVKNRQNSIETKNDVLQQEWLKHQKEMAEIATNIYTWATNNGIAKEVARAVLPEGLTTTKMYMNGTIRSWITYIALREKSGTQKEHMEVAKECKRIILEIIPGLAAALGGYSEPWTV